ncbi:MAG: type II toxin-antitoxin system VapC family toxin [Proteobacteria bacterium]|nr:type II toxin-antitoxin system VapC family toxin [Pseudomonadota bacterium]
MTSLVLDASVCLKWFLPEANEQDVDIAQAIKSRMRDGDIALIQPPVWHSEIAAVLARQLPQLAARFTTELMRIGARIETDPQCMKRAIELSIRCSHHLFDTIYHAIAIEYGLDLVTADEHYYRKARALGSIVLLKDWRWKPQGVAEPHVKYIAKPRRRRPSKKS